MFHRVWWKICGTVGPRILNRPKQCIFNRKLFVYKLKMYYFTNYVHDLIQNINIPKMNDSREYSLSVRSYYAHIFSHSGVNETTHVCVVHWPHGISKGAEFEFWIQKFKGTFDQAVSSKLPTRQRSKQNKWINSSSNFRVSIFKEWKREGCYIVVHNDIN